MPSLAMTRSERVFAGTVKETISVSPAWRKPWATAAAAASVA